MLRKECLGLDRIGEGVFRYAVVKLGFLPGCVVREFLDELKVDCRSLERAKEQREVNVSKIFQNQKKIKIKTVITVKS